jgi:ABC-type lipoprotein export system ATPase subunit
VPDVVLRGEGLERTFGSGAAAVHAVTGIDLTLKHGELLLVMGPSGSGKTTLVSMLGGLLTPTAGRVVLDGKDLYEQDERERAHLRLRHLGFIFQSFNLLSALTAEDNVAAPLRLAGVRGDRTGSRARALLGQLGLADRVTHRPRDLSGGEKQRVAIARALANDPEIVLADEPTANLDSASGREVVEILRRLADEGRAVIVVSHDERLKQLASNLVRIEDGRLGTDADPS